MKRLWCVVVAGLALAPAALPAQIFRGTNRCVACHQQLPERSQAGHSFQAWRQSRHGTVGVSCNACHGGDPTATDTARAHRGIARSTNRSSPVFYTRIPQTCGRCHAAELGYFRASRHFARLSSDGRGPNCVTCHGAMATAVLTAEEVLATCSACHAPGGAAPPDKARESAPILSLVRAETMLYHVVTTVAEAAPQAQRSRAAPALQSAQRTLGAAAEVWHTFRLDSASARLAAARGDLSTAWSALGYHTDLDASVRGRQPGSRP